MGRSWGLEMAPEPGVWLCGSVLYHFSGFIKVYSLNCSSEFHSVNDFSTHRLIVPTSVSPHPVGQQVYIYIFIMWYYVICSQSFYLVTTFLNGDVEFIHYQIYTLECGPLQLLDLLFHYGLKGQVGGEEPRPVEDRQATGQRGGRWRREGEEEKQGEVVINRWSRGRTKEK